jgi:hypothetical protein
MKLKITKSGLGRGYTVDIYDDTKMVPARPDPNFSRTRTFPPKPLYVDSPEEVDTVTGEVTEPAMRREIDEAEYLTVIEAEAWRSYQSEFNAAPDRVLIEKDPTA